MFVPMAISTRKIVVFGRVLLKQARSFLMTCPTVMRWGFSNVSDLKRHVNRMAGLTGLKIHVLGVFFVTFHAIRDLPVDLMALVASHVRMCAGVVFHLFTLLLVAGKARASNFTF